MRTTRRARRPRAGIAAAVSLSLLIGTVCVPAAGQEDDGWSWWAMLVYVFRADAVPEPPKLGEKNRERIDQVKYLAASQLGRDTDAGRLLLGLLALAEGHGAEAREQFDRLSPAGPDPSLPLRLKAQSYMVDRNFAKAVELHKEALRKMPRVRGRSPMTEANAHLDLAVAYAALRRREQAEESVRKAKNVLTTTRMAPIDRAFSYLMVADVYGKVLGKRDAAKAALQNAERALPRNLAASVDLRIARDIYLKLGGLSETAILKKGYFRRAAGTVKGLPEKDRDEANYYVGRKSAQLAGRPLRADPEFGRFVRMQLEPVVKAEAQDGWTLRRRRAAYAVQANLARDRDDGDGLRSAIEGFKAVQNKLISNQIQGFPGRLELRHEPRRDPNAAPRH